MASDTDNMHPASYTLEIMFPQRGIDVAPKAAATNSHPHVFFINFNTVERFHIDNDTTLNTTRRREMVATTFDRNLQI
jgi:hypothetical protein